MSRWRQIAILGLNDLRLAARDRAALIWMLLLPLALMWLELATAGGQPETFDLRGAIMQSMTEAEREESARLLAQWRATHAINGTRP